MKTVKNSFRIESDPEAFLLSLILNRWNCLDLVCFEVKDVILCISVFDSSADNIVAYAIIRCRQHLVRL